MKYKLAVIFKIVDIGPISYYWGLKIEKACQNKILKLFQLVYIGKNLAKYHFNQVQPYYTLMKKVILLSNKGSKAS